jgi:alpha-glucosidase
MINRGAHHDGSSLYVSDQSPNLNDYVTLRLRTSRYEVPDKVFLRTVADGEPQFMEASLVETTDSDQWWQAKLHMHNPFMHYRWLLSGGAFHYSWFNAIGLIDHDIPDSTDFDISCTLGAPDWSLQQPVYQIFPDRFARHSGKDQLGTAFHSYLPTWAVPRSWVDHPEGRGPNTPFEYFGGDLLGVVERLDHVSELGCGVLYSTPIFTAGSTHRYDASTFNEVDPLLGGHTAINELVGDLHDRGMYFIGDITLNHCGKNHQWFESAQDPAMPERDFFIFDSELDHGYECWCDVPSLPKFNYGSHELRERLISGSDSAVRSWLRAPHRWDGWRVDVANMTGRLRSEDMTLEVATLTRKSMEAEASDLVLLAEHGHDSSADLPGDGWHGTMNYAGFTRPVWSWLRGEDFHEQFMGVPVEVPVMTGAQAVRTMQEFHGRIPWRALISSWNILSSHDSARIRSVVGSRERQEAAIALAVGLPGIPMIFAGDEIGAEGLWGEDSRTPFPWHASSVWDHQTLFVYRSLLNLRKASSTLARGGLRWLHIADDCVAFVRDSNSESLLFVVSRNPTPALVLNLKTCGLRDPEHLLGFEGKVIGHQLNVEIPRAGVGVWHLKGNASWLN